MQNYFTVYNKNFYDAFNGDLKQVVEYLKNSGSVGKIIHISRCIYLFVCSFLGLSRI